MSIRAKALHWLPADVVSLIREKKRKTVDLLEELQTRVRFGPRIAGVCKQVLQESMTYCTRAQLRSLIATCRQVESAPGMPPTAAIIEAGCARGGSAITLCATKSARRPLRLYDVFGEIPPPGEQDSEDLKKRYEVVRQGKAEWLGGQKYYAYEDDLEAVVKSNFQRLGFPFEDHDVRSYKGLVQDTLDVPEAVCLAHIDVDNFDAVRTCLERIVPRIPAGGAVVIHAYFNWGSSRKATDTYFEGKAGNFDFDGTAGHMVIRKIA